MKVPKNSEKASWQYSLTRLQAYCSGGGGIVGGSLGASLYFSFWLISTLVGMEDLCTEDSEMESFMVGIGILE